MSSILVTADCLISTAAIKLAAQHDIPIIFNDRAGNAVARMWNPYHGKEAQVRRHQYAQAENQQATEWVIEWFELKTERQIEVLRRLYVLELEKIEPILKRMQQKQKALDRLSGQSLPQVHQNILTIESGVARLYWKALSEGLSPKWQFQKRSRRPAEDPFNAILNYWYGMLYNIVESAIFAAGLDPQLGVFHKDAWNQPTLSFDLIEPFRPWVDERLINYCQNNKLLSTYFVDKGKGIWLSKMGRKALIPIFNAHFHEEITINGNTASRKNQIYIFINRWKNELHE